MLKRQNNFGQKLLVEVKLHGKEPSNMANLVADKFKELGIEKDCMVVSFDLKLMEEIKKILPELKIGYIIPLLLGDLPDTNVDFYAIEDFSYNETLAIQAKIKKKKLMIWTINDIIKIRIIRLKTNNLPCFIPYTPLKNTVIIEISISGTPYYTSFSTKCQHIISKKLISFQNRYSRLAWTK